MKKYKNVMTTYLNDEQVKDFKEHAESVGMPCATLIRTLICKEMKKEIQNES